MSSRAPRVLSVRNLDLTIMKSVLKTRHPLPGWMLCRQIEDAGNNTASKWVASK